VSNVHLVIPDSHAHPKHNNRRAEWLGKLILDIKPDRVIHIGDSADMPSLSSYDRGKKAFQGRTYLSDIESHLDFSERLWGVVRAAKKRLPHRVFCMGNHEERITRAINIQPELEGTISLDDLKLTDYYDEVVEYSGNTPGVVTYDGVAYGHYMVSGIMSRPVGGEHIGYSLISKRLSSSVVGHNHLADLCIRTDNSDRKVIGLSVGCYIDYEVDWAGKSQDLWWRGIVVLRNVSDGQFDPQFISLDSIKKEYS
jgi:hypothetical protein